MPMLSSYCSAREAAARRGYYVVTPEGHAVECAKVERDGEELRWDVRFADGREYEGLSAARITEALEAFAGYTPARARAVAFAAHVLAAQPSLT